MEKKKPQHVGYLKLLAFLLYRFSSLLLCANSQPSSSNDASVMLALKKSLNPPASFGWSDPNPCKWSYVGCSDDKRVTRIQIGHQNIQGTLPPSLQNLTQLERLELQWNNISGPLPSLSGLGSLQVLLLSNNLFTSIPSDFFTGMTSLQSVEIDNNPFTAWEIPQTLQNASSLQNFSANSANITGKIPDFFNTDAFPGLVNLHLAFNYLEGQLPESFSGSEMQSLWLNGQQSVGKLVGSIGVLSNMTTLTEVWLHSNGFSGPLPDFSGLTDLRSLSLRDNLFTGPVSVSLLNLKSLESVNLTNNLLQGPMPEFPKGVSVDMTKDSNNFCLPSPGQCDPRVDTLLLIVSSMSYPQKFAENWKGNDPCADWIGVTCRNGNITVLNFQKMGLTGTISPAFASLKSLQRVVLADNNLTGSIPEELATLPALTQLDVSNNLLYGKIPAFTKANVIVNTDGNPDIRKEKSTNGPSQNSTNPSTSISGNGNGSGPHGKKSSNLVGVIVFSVIGGVFVMFLIALLVICLYRTKQKRLSRVQSPNAMVIHPRHSGSDNESMKITVAGSSVSVGALSEAHTVPSSEPSDIQMVEAGNMVISIQVLRNVTNNFSEENILGRGGFVTVYKGELHDGTKIAVKRMEAGVIAGKGLTEFKSEIAVLTKVRHRHLVALLGYCLDGNKRLLVYEYMPQGTLSRYIFNWPEEGLKPLEWTKRLTIALDVARGVEYLHSLAHQSFIHRDLKPSNILLGDDLRAKVADFGLVRLAPEGKGSIETRIAGTFGYLAPEYAVLLKPLELPTAMTPLPPPLSRGATRKAKKKQIQHQHAELERLDSLPWNPSSSVPLPNDNDDDDDVNGLEGGFLMLEEIDEADYGLDIPALEVETSSRNKKCKPTKRSKKRKHDQVDALGVQDEKDMTKKLEEPDGNGGSEDNDGDAGSKKKMNKKKKKKGTAKDTQKIEESTADGKDEVEEQVDEYEYHAWNELRLHPLIMRSIYRLGFKEPTAIQKACIPAAAHQGKDVVGAAETGSGKTLAFGLPILQRLLDEREKAVKVFEEKGEEAEKVTAKGFLRALVITPTRELSLQVSDHLKAVAKDTDIRVVAIVGGMSTDKQERLLRSRPEIVVGTPGRLWELMSGGEKHLVELHSLSFFVLDEADRMIESGHFHELQSIIDMLPLKNSSSVHSGNTQDSVTMPNIQRKKRQTFVLSATIALSADFRKKLKRSSLKPKQSTSDGVNSIEALSERAGMRDNVAIIDLTNTSILANKLEESFIECREEDKDAYLYYILSVHGQGRTIIFCTSIAALRHITSLLRILGTDVLTLHAQMHQRARLKRLLDIKVLEWMWVPLAYQESIPNETPYSIPKGEMAIKIKAIDRFRGSEHGKLVATDVAARGLDIPGVRTVIHYQLPHSAEVYVHRSGRTARATADGCSIALIAPNETSKFASLCKSFSKLSFQRFPLENSYFPEVMRRLSLARQIDKILRKDSQDRAKKSWYERNAELVELVVDSDEDEEDRVKNYKQKKASSMNLKNLQQELKMLLSRPLQPKSFSHRYLTGSGITPLMQDQFEELAKQKLGDSSNSGKRSKMVVIGQNCVEPLQALRSSGHEVHIDVKEAAQKRRNMENLRRKRKDEKKRLRDDRRKRKKQLKGGE